MILSASRRTDIPCHYSQWFLNRLREGYALVRNPMNPHKISKIELSPEVVDCIVFWTKDPAPMLGSLDELDRMGYRYCFQFTVTPYETDLERGLRSKSEMMETFGELSRRIGKERVFWRYDPILISGSYHVENHHILFAEMCEKLSHFTSRVTLSFVDLYRKNNLPYRAPDLREIAELSAHIGKVASEHGITPMACCEAVDLTQYGIVPSACIDRKALEQVCGFPLALSPHKGQRPGCHCVESVDLGAYDTCTNGCIYCYANHGRSGPSRGLYDPLAPLLCGTVGEGDSIAPRPLRSNRVNQLKF